MSARRKLNALPSFIKAWSRTRPVCFSISIKRLTVSVINRSLCRIFKQRLLFSQIFLKEISWDFDKPLAQHGNDRKLPIIISERNQNNKIRWDSCECCMLSSDPLLSSSDSTPGAAWGRLLRLISLCHSPHSSHTQTKETSFASASRTFPGRCFFNWK